MNILSINIKKIIHFNTIYQKIIFLLIIALILFLFIIILAVDNVEAVTITVDDDGSADYIYIQDAINISNDGDTVYVHNGIYLENLSINKSINLIGEDKNSTIIDGGRNAYIADGDVIYVNADYVNITGFTITGGGWFEGDAGIEFHNADKCIINSNNIFSNYWIGIFLNHSNDNVIIGNVITDEVGGIKLNSSHNNYIINNSASNSWYGIRLFSSTYNNITGNELLNGKFGIILESSIENLIKNNNVSSHNHSGFYIKGSNNNIIKNNIVFNNNHCLLLILANSNNILDNNLSTNENGIYLTPLCDFNNIHNNSILYNQYGFYFQRGINNNTYYNNIFQNNQIQIYIDTDGDGVEDENDAFPNDITASLDTDGDGYPDRWSPYYYSQLYSPTGLEVDAFPKDPSEWKDTDGDRHGDNSDAYPNDPNRWEKAIIEPEEAICGTMITVIIAILIGGTELGKYQFILFYIPLYTRIKKEEVLDQFTRGRIYEYIRNNPGDHYNNIKQNLELKNGTLTFHVRTLEKGNYIKSRRDGIYKRFYPVGMKIPDKPKLRLSAIQKEILMEIRQNYGVTQKEIAKALDISQQVVSYHVNLMIKSGFLKTENQDNTLRYFAEESIDISKIKMR